MYSPSELANYVSSVAETKVNRKFLKILISAILAGMFIGLGYYSNIILVARSFEDIRFLGAIIFCVGIVLVIITGADLYTGNCLVMFGVVDNKLKFKDVLIHLLIVLLGNFIGALFLAMLIFLTSSQGDVVAAYVTNLVEKKLSLSFGKALLSGILCNLLVALGVYMAYAAKDISGKILASVLAVTAFVITGFEHCVANMFLFPLSLMHGTGSIITMFLGNLVPVIIGNFIGGGIIIPFMLGYLYLDKNKNTNNKT